MSHTDIIKAIRQFMAQGLENESFTAEQLVPEGSNILETHAALAHMLGCELICSHKGNNTTLYFRSGAFVARKITPLFAGTPEWVVETFEGRLCCWCPSEFDARIIADAMKRS